MNEEWLGGNMNNDGGGYKINLLRNALEPYRDDTEKIILFTDRYKYNDRISEFNIKCFSRSYDVLFTTTLEVIVHKFKKLDARILFGAEKYIWPDDKLEHLYPAVAKHLPKYLNSGLFIGKIFMLKKILFPFLIGNTTVQILYRLCF